MAPDRVVLELTVDRQRASKVYRASLGSVLFLTSSPELQNLELELYCEGPTGGILEFQDSVLLSAAGPYTFTFSDPFLYTRSDVTMTVLVDPVIRHTPASTALHLDNVALHSHLTKCCGVLENWESVFQVSAECGYNMVHLTPVQLLGISKSSYCLHSHLTLCNEISGGTYEEGLELLSDRLQLIHKNTGLHFLTDVVWNHVSICNTDILQYPASYYNLWNTPNLIPAYLIDRAIAVCSADIEAVVPDVTTMQHVNTVCNMLREHLYYTTELLCDMYRIPTENVQADVGRVERGVEDMLYTHWSVDYTQQNYGGSVDWKALNNMLYNRDGTERVIRRAIDSFNKHRVPEIVQGIIEKVMCAVEGAIKYRFIDDQGPRMSLNGNPLVERYFHVPGCTPLEELSLDIYTQQAAERVMTCNGWTMGESIADMSSTKAYLHRDVVIWGDNVKLRYGSGPEDSPRLWEYMKRYTCDMARVFDGLRIDNCHNTPVHVGEYMLQAARTTRPNLYVVAELFTGNETTDCRIINKMGLNSCIRELSQAGSPTQLGEQMYHYGESKPCGSFLQDSTVSGGTLPATRLLSSRPHALLMEHTHDNPCPFDKHPVPNVLAMSGMMAAAKCSIGSNRGYDELVPHHLDVVKEERLYLGSGSQIQTGGIKAAKSALIDIHNQLERDGFSETFVDQKTRDVVIVTRHNPVTCEKVLVVIATQFTDDVIRWEGTINIPGKEVSVMLEAELLLPDKLDYIRNIHYITGYTNVEVRVSTEKVQSVSWSNNDEDETLDVKIHLSPGMVLVLKITPTEKAQRAMECFVNFVENPTQMSSLTSTLSLLDLNYLLYRCDPEEQADGCGGVYTVPGHGKLPYAGIQGFLSTLEDIRATNNMGHALCRNIVEGCWAAEYTAARLCLKKGTHELGRYLGNVFLILKDMPDYMRPKVFDKVLRTLFDNCEKRVAELIPTYGKRCKFEQQLMLTSIQLVGAVKDTGIATSVHTIPLGSMAAGLPHFSHGFMRCWGRDTFISLPGLLLSTGRLDEAQNIIVGFARTLRHGLIPNLLSERGHKPRYNCRDAPWWWCRAVQLLWKLKPDVLETEVERLFDAEDKPAANKCRVLDILQEILSRHAAGIEFIEQGAGPTLDEHLRQEGFKIEAGVDTTTGFITGGSQHNCGTWMDKVGSSNTAGNRGIPSTPREGSAIELVALSYQTIIWMIHLHDNRKSPYTGVTVATSPVTIATTLTYKRWANLIENNFERYYWYQEGGYYKDTVSGVELRPNQAVAMVAAPGLFDPIHLGTALVTMANKLAGPLGMCTLSRQDKDYRPYYDNGDQSNDFKTAHGFNYHQGPEWVWCMGFYMRAKYHHLADKETLYTLLAPHRIQISSSPYRGLTELTNKDGEECPGSCPTQAWSSACLLELMEDILSGRHVLRGTRC